MVFVVPKYEIVYAPVPKAACTSLKRAMYRLEHGREFEAQMVNGARVGIQNTFPTVPFRAKDIVGLKTPWVFSVLRDPASRVLSTWSNKIMTHRRLAEANAFRRSKRGKINGFVGRAFGTDGLLNPFPTVEEFILNLEAYFKLYHPVRHHVSSVGVFLGGDLSIYDRIYTMKELPQLEADIRARTGVADFTIPTSNTSPTEIKVTIDDLSDDAFDALMTWLEPEYELLGQWFEKPSRQNRNMQKTGTI